VGASGLQVTPPLELLELEPPEPAALLDPSTEDALPEDAAAEDDPATDDEPARLLDTTADEPPLEEEEDEDEDEEDELELVELLSVPWVQPARTERINKHTRRMKPPGWEAAPKGPPGGCCGGLQCTAYAGKCAAQTRQGRLKEGATSAQQSCHAYRFGCHM